jgi:hypothetical protein
MSVELAGIALNLSKLAAKAGQQQEPLVEELAREIFRLCQVVQRLEQSAKPPNGGSAESRPRAG